MIAEPSRDPDADHRGAAEPAAAPNIAATVVIPLHNHAAYIVELLESLFAQWRPDLELLLIDDHSSDGGYERVQEVLARHPEVCATTARTAYPEGVGLVRRVQSLARGRIIIGADSDDVALPGRLRAMMACFEADEGCRLVSTNALLMSGGQAIGIYDTLSASTVIHGPLRAAATAGDTRWLGTTMAYHRDVYDRFPPLDDELCPYGLDMLIPFRALLLGSHHYLAEPLVGWRQHGTNTHRVAGQHDPSDAAQERFQGLLMSVLAQKLRDAEFMACETPSPTLDEAVRLCRAQFHACFEQWCRLRTRVSRSAPARADAVRGMLSPAAPPVPTLAAGEVLRFAACEFASRILPHYSGFNAPEPWGVWTERVAQLSLRIVSPPEATVWLELELSSSRLTDRHRVAVRVDACAWVEVEMGPEEHRTVAVPSPAVAAARVVNLVIVARDALRPAEVDPASEDGRLVGIGLVSVAARHSPLDPILDGEVPTARP